jgi:hypothetical protein
METEMFGLDKIANAITKPLDLVSKGLEFTDKLKDIPVIGGIAEKALDATPVGKVLNAVETGVGAASALAKGDVMGVVNEFKDGAIKMIPGGEAAMGLLGKVNDFTGGKLEDIAGNFVQDRLSGARGFTPPENIGPSIDSLASQVSGLSLEEIASLDESELDEIFANAGMSPEMLQDLMDGTVDPFSTSVLPGGNFGRDPFGTVNPNNTSSTGTAGTSGGTNGTTGRTNGTTGGTNGTTGGSGFDFGSFTPPDSARTRPDMNKKAEEAQANALAAAGYGDFMTDLQIWGDDNTTRNQMDSTAAINANKMMRDVHSSIWESGSASIAGLAQKASRGYQG